jgi:hypothetical protein
VRTFLLRLLPLLGLMFAARAAMSQSITYNTTNSYVYGTAVTLTPTITGGTATNATVTTGTLPTGLALGTNGTITGTPDAVGGPTSLKVRVKIGGTTYTSTAFTIQVTTAPLTVTATGPAKPYGTALTAGTSTTNFTYSGTVLGQTVTSVTLTPNAAGLSSTTPVGNPYTVTPSAATGGGGFLASNYTITYNSYTGAVTTGNLNITANVSKVYGTTLTGGTGFTGFTATGLATGETVGSVTVAYGTGSATTDPVATNTGQVSVSAATGGTFNPSNYTITYTAGTITVTKAPLTVTANNQSKTYGNTFTFAGTEFTTAGLLNSDAVATVTLTSTGSVSTANVGTYNIIPSNAVGTGLTNYTITYADGSMTVTQAPLTVTATGPLKPYGTALTAGTSTTNFTYSGAITGQAVTRVTLTPDANGASSTTPIGNPYVITPSAATGTGGFLAGNYSITYMPYIGTVTAGSLTITANNVSKVYGATLTGAAGSAAFTATGLASGETVGSVTIAYGTGSAATDPVGTYATQVTPSAATGGSFNPSNYTITYTAGTITVTKAPLTVTANNQSKTYGNTFTFAGTEFTTSGLLNSDAVTSVTLTSTGSATAANVGTYTIVPSNAVGTGLSNYNITYANGTMTVTQAPLTVTATGPLKPYGTTITAGTSTTNFTYSGTIAGQAVTRVTLTPDANGASATTPVGSAYVITPSAATGTGGFVAGNYSITYVPYNGTVTTGSLTITANNITKVYGATLTGGTGSTAFAATGLAAGETVGSVTIAYGTGSAATDPVATNTGQVTPSVATGGSFNPSNYTITYVSGTITVTKATLTITANGVSKVYGTALTGGAGSTAYTPTGLQNGETIGSVTIAYGAAAAAGTAVGTYAAEVTPSAATGGTFNAGNYNITYAKGTITVTQALLVITANDQTRTYGVNSTFTVTYSGFVNGDTYASLTTQPTVTSTGTASSPVGMYPITASGAVDNNYSITYVAGTLTITIAGPNIYDWTGADNSTVWTDPKNWDIAGAQQTVNYPGLSAAGDYADIGVNYNYTARQPTLSVTLANSISSITFGANNGTTMTLTVTGVTLTVTGAVTQMHNSLVGGSIANIAGTGTLGCSSFAVGDNTTPASPSGTIFFGFGTNPPSQNSTTLNSSISNLTVNGNLTLNSTSSGLGTYTEVIVNFQDYSVNNPVFNLTGGTLTVNNIIASNSNEINNYNDGDPFIGTISNSTSYNQDLGATANTLILLGANPITAVTGTVIDFVDGGTAANSTVNYAAASASQEVYTSTNTAINTAPAIYPTLTLSGASTKTADGGTLTTSSGFNTSGGTVSLNINNPAASVAGAWTNSTIVNEGSGTLLVSGSLANNTGGTINGNIAAAAATITGSSVNTGTITGNAENMTFTAAAVNNAIITGGTGTLTFSNTFTSNNTGATVTCGSGTVTFTGNYLNNSGSFMEGPGNVFFNGNYSVTGAACIFAAGTGTTYFNKAGAQTLSDNSTAGTTFNKVTFENSGAKTMSAGSFFVSSSGMLTMAGSATLAAGGFLTLNSDASGSASVAPITSGTPISGIVNVQRYVSGARGYRLLSSPVHANTTGTNIYSINYLANSLYLTGSGSGFTATGNPTVYLYDEGFVPQYTTFYNSNFIAISSLTGGTGAAPSYSVNTNGAGLTSTYSIPVSNGYYCFYRGNLSEGTANLTNPSYPAAAATLSAPGTLNQGQVQFKAWYTPTSNYLGDVSQTYNLVGNPYASAIDLATIQGATTGSGIYATGISGFVYELNPASGNYGIYTYTNPALYPPTNGASEFIASGEGFFVQATSTTAIVAFNETAKATSANANAPGLMAQRLANFNPVNTIPVLRLKLSADSINTDETIIAFNPNASSKYVFNEDAPHRAGQGIVGMSSMSGDNVKLAINATPLQTNMTIPLNVNATIRGLYNITLNQLNPLPSIYEVWLKDAYKKDSLDIKDNPVYNFDINISDTASFGSNRFSLVIRENPALMVHLLSFNANKAITGVNVLWTTENEQNYTNFAVERSTDGGKTFADLGGFVSSAVGAYTYLDKNPVVGANMYRLKMIDLNGVVSYSQVVTIMYSNTSNTIALNGGMMVYPNPTSGIVNLSITQTSNVSANAAASVSYRIQIVNNLGQEVRSAVSETPAWSSDVTSLLPGTYFINVVNAGNNAIVGKSAFVKL